MEIKSTLETAVGIEQYLNKDIKEGIKGIIKHRCSDFAVNEIDDDGQVVVITDLAIPEIDLKRPVPSDEEVCYSSLEVRAHLPLSIFDNCF